MLATTYLSSPHWLSAGDTSWQLTAATLVGLMSLPGIAVLYGVIVKKKWAVNTMGFGSSWLHLGSSARDTVLGKPGAVLGASTEIGQASIPQTGNLAGPSLQFSSSALVYFQFVFAAITPRLFLGSVLGRMSLKAGLIFVPLWTTCAYTVNAMLLWGGGF